MSILYRFVNGAENFLDLAHLGLVLQEDGGIEVGNLAAGALRSKPLEARQGHTGGALQWRMRKEEVC